MKLVVIDYDSGNLRSVSRALESQGVTPLVTGDAAEFDDADAMVLPGVGSGPAAMDALNQRNLVAPSAITSPRESRSWASAWACNC